MSAPRQTLREVKRTYLEMHRREDLRPAAAPDSRARVEQVIGCPASFYRYLYAEVGRSHHWVDRAAWTDDEICSHLANPHLTLWVLYVSGAPAGYFELLGHADGAVELAYFGLLPEFKGHGLGKYLLTVAVERAWTSGARRVWLHTCTLDDPAALPNYISRGFLPFREETYWVDGR
jgi:GNAT superfamily N-acetyltransferase